MSDTATVELRLMDQVLHLKTTDDKKDELQHAARLLNEKFLEMQRNAPRAEYHKLCLMVALQLMQDVIGLNKTIQQYEHCETVLKAIVSQIDESSLAT